MTTTQNPPRHTFALVDEVRSIRAVPDRAKRKEIRRRARLSQARIAVAVGVSQQRVWQWENRVDELPMSENALRYVALLEQLDAATIRPISPQE